MQKDETITKYVDRITLIDIIIRLVGEEFTVKQIMDNVLVSLPKSFETKILSHKESKDLGKLSFCELMSTFKEKKQRGFMRLEKFTKGAFSIQKQIFCKGK